jgi:hypothetical protein
MSKVPDSASCSVIQNEEKLENQDTCIFIRFIFRNHTGGGNGGDCSSCCHGEGFPRGLLRLRGAASDSLIFLRLIDCCESREKFSNFHCWAAEFKF